MCDFNLFLKNKIRTVFELEYMCSVFTYVQYIFKCITYMENVLSYNWFKILSPSLQRGKCKVVQCNTLEAVRSFKPVPDSFYCLLGYNPETKRLATTQGQIRVGSMYQVREQFCILTSVLPHNCHIYPFPNDTF